MVGHQQPFQKTSVEHMWRHHISRCNGSAISKQFLLAEEWKREKRRGIYFTDNEHMISNEVEAFQTGY